MPHCFHDDPRPWRSRGKLDCHYVVHGRLERTNADLQLLPLCDAVHIWSAQRIAEPRMGGDGDDRARVCGEHSVHALHSACNHRVRLQVREEANRIPPRVPVRHHLHLHQALQPPGRLNLRLERHARHVRCPVGCPRLVPQGDPQVALSCPRQLRHHREVEAVSHVSIDERVGWVHAKQCDSWHCHCCILLHDHEVLLRINVCAQDQVHVAPRFHAHGILGRRRPRPR
mmetsp:Transcript_48981/g.99976  ORF Transcript_48981/g.99976 Transcript_48981/m.99976 type:complete len:228 (-) Transcript_48981:778-1461(-)